MEDSLNIYSNSSNFYNIQNDGTLIQDIFFYASGIAGVLSNILLITIILRDKNMQTRTNIILMNWCINDGAFVLLAVLLRDLLSKLHMIPGDFRCVIDSTLLLQFNSAFFMFFLLTNRLINNQGLSLLVLYKSVYGIEGAILVYHIMFCKLYQQIPVFNFLPPAAFIIVLSALIVKEVITCTSKPGDFTDSCGKWRINIVRIFTFNWGLLWVFVLARIFDWEILYFVYQAVSINVLLTPVLIMSYVMSTDNDFVLCKRNELAKNSETGISMELDPYSSNVSMLGDSKILETGRFTVISL